MHDSTARRSKRSRPWVNRYPTGPPRRSRPPLCEMSTTAWGSIRRRSSVLSWWSDRLRS